MPARLRSPDMRLADASFRGSAVGLLGRPGGRRVRLKAATSSGKIAQTTPTLVPYSRCLMSKRRTYASDAFSSVAASATDKRRGRLISEY